MNFVYVLDIAQLKCPDLYEYWYRKMPEARQKKIDAFKFENQPAHSRDFSLQIKSQVKIEDC